MPDTVDRIQEKTVFVAPDGTQHDTMDAACDHVERKEFLQFMADRFIYATDGVAVGEEILNRWTIRPRNRS